MNKIKLEYLKDDLTLINGKTGELVEVKDIKDVIKCGEASTSDAKLDKDSLLENWYIAIENEYHLDGYYAMKNILMDASPSEDSPTWISKAIDALNNQVIDYNLIEQTIMSELKKVDGITEFYIKGDLVDIDNV